MPPNLIQKLAIIGVLFAAIAIHTALARAGMLHEAIPAITVGATLILIGILTYPRQRPRTLAGVGPMLAIVAMAFTAWLAYLVVFSADGEPLRHNLGWLALPGLGIASASAVNRLLLLKDEILIKGGVLETLSRS